MSKTALKVRSELLAKGQTIVQWAKQESLTQALGFGNWPMAPSKP